MTRLYDPLGSFTCSVCNKHSNMGWLYRCTQDHDGFLPECDFTSTRTTTVALDFSAHCLNPWIVKDIGKGQYTDEQIKTLIKQKEKVRDTIFGTTGRPPTSSTSTTTSSFSEGAFSILPQSTTFSTASTSSLDEEIKAAYDWKELQKVWMSEPSVPPPECQYKAPLASTTQLIRGPTLPADQICDFKVCPHCRPTYRERAHQSLDQILNQPVQFPPIWELENRKLSDARVISGMELPGLSRFYAQNNNSLFQSDNSVLEQTVGDGDAPPSTQQIDDSQFASKRSGFRHTVRKALARARVEDPAPPSNVSDSDSGHPSDTDTSRPSRSLIFRRRRSRPALSFSEAHGRVIDTSALQDSVMLMLATNTPLPLTPTMSRRRLSRFMGQSTAQNGHTTSSQAEGRMVYA